MKYKVVLLIIIAIVTIGFTVFDIFYEKKEDIESLYIQVPIASKSINKYETITEEDIKYTSVYKDFVQNSNIILDTNSIIGKHSSGNISENEFFYASGIVTEIYDSQDYESLYNVNVPREYQSIIKNYDYIDLWLDGNEDNYIISTPLVENIKIYYYLDNADNVITSENKNVASIILDVPVEVNNALEKIADNPDFNIYPVVKSPESVEDITINDIIYSFS